jgi:hypothetical protein
MSETVTVVLPKAFQLRLANFAIQAWGSDEADERYAEAVTCGNADDTFDAGETQGAAWVAKEILEYIVK